VLLDRLSAICTDTGVVRDQADKLGKSIAEWLHDTRIAFPSLEEAVGFIAAGCAAKAQAWRARPETAQIGAGLPDKERQDKVQAEYRSAVGNGLESIRQAMLRHPDYQRTGKGPLTFTLNKPRQSAITAGTATVQATVSESKRAHGGTGKASTAPESAGQVEKNPDTFENIQTAVNACVAQFGLYPMLARFLSASSVLDHGAVAAICCVLEAAQSTEPGKHISLQSVVERARKAAAAAAAAKGNK
jgi:hypothetical protein